MTRVQKFFIQSEVNLSGQSLYLWLVKCWVFVFLWGSAGQARVFQFGNESFASYLKGAYQPAQQKQDPFADSTGTGLTFSDQYATNTAYEFGFVYSMSRINIKFGFEVLKPTDLKNISAKNSAGVEQATLSNNISGYCPRVGLEFNLRRWNTARVMVSAVGGYATITVQNSYSLTSAGQTNFPGVADFREEVQGSAPLYEGSLGFESLISDTSTFLIEAGYRSLKVPSFKHNAPVTSFQGTFVKGDQALKNDGSNRTLNLSGGFAALSWRIWID